MASPPELVIVIDAVDTAVVAEFWAAALHYDRAPAVGQYEVLTAPGEHRSPMVLIQGVDEPKAVKNRVHLDLHVADAEAEAERLVALGATRLGANSLGAIRWVTMADPEGNEFDLGWT